LNKVAIMTDTVSQMTKELADAYDIKLVPITIIIDGKPYPETEIELQWYYQQIPKWKESGDIPTSSSASIGYFAQAFRELSQRVESILYICYSSKFGMMFNTALQAKKKVKEELPQTAIVIIDTLTVCGAQMLIAIEAARAAAAAKSLAEVSEMTNSLVNRVSMISLIDDLSLLAKGGRIHKALPWAGSKVTNTALLEVDASTRGEMTPLVRCKTREQALKKLFEIVSERSGGRRLNVAINHADALIEAEELRELALSRFPCAECFIAPLYPTVTHHDGLGVVKFSWWAAD
jgi:DegV family protein with EDD domain